MVFTPPKKKTGVIFILFLLILLYSFKNNIFLIINKIQLTNIIWVSLNY